MHLYDSCTWYPLAPWQAFRFLPLYRIVSAFHRLIVIVTELPKYFRYVIIVSLPNDKTEAFGTISNNIKHKQKIQTVGSQA